MILYLIFIIKLVCNYFNINNLMLQLLYLDNDNNQSIFSYYINNK